MNGQNRKHLCVEDLLTKGPRVAEMQRRQRWWGGQGAGKAMDVHLILKSPNRKTEETSEWDWDRSLHFQWMRENEWELLVNVGAPIILKGARWIFFPIVFVFSRRRGKLVRKQLSGPGSLGGAWKDIQRRGWKWEEIVYHEVKFVEGPVEKGFGKVEGDRLSPIKGHPKRCGVKSLQL